MKRLLKGTFLFFLILGCGDDGSENMSMAGTWELQSIFGFCTPDLPFQPPGFWSSEEKFTFSRSGTFTVTHNEQTLVQGTWSESGNHFSITTTFSFPGEEPFTATMTGTFRVDGNLLTLHINVPDWMQELFVRLSLPPDTECTEILWTGIRI